VRKLSATLQAFADPKTSLRNVNEKERTEYHAKASFHGWTAKHPPIRLRPATVLHDLFLGKGGKGGGGAPDEGEKGTNFTRQSRPTQSSCFTLERGNQKRGEGRKFRKKRKSKKKTRRKGDIYQSKFKAEPVKPPGKKKGAFPAGRA